MENEPIATEFGAKSGRRTVLGGIASIVGMGLAGTGLNSRVQASEQPDGPLTILGDFESDLDGWKTNGGNTLNRVTNDDFQGVATRGNHALSVVIDGDSHPLVQNKKRVMQADFAGSPYLLADVSTVFDGYDGDVVFQYRYHYRPGGPGRGGGPDTSKHTGGDAREKSVHVLESPKITVPQLSTKTVYWVMSDIADEKLERPSRLQLTWYPAEHPPANGANGRNRAEDSFTHRGITFVDNVRLTNNPNHLGEPGLDDTFARFRRRHGPIDHVERNEVSDQEVDGAYVFDDGTAVDYRFTITGDEAYVFAIAGEQFKLGGEWS